MNPLVIIFFVLIALWLLGVGTFGVLAGGGLIHLLLVIALIIIVYHLVRGERL